MRPASIMSPCERGSNLRFDRHTAATSRAGGRVSIHLSHRVVQNVERPRGALNPAMRDATDTRHHVCERRHATQAARSGRLEGSHMRMERVAHDERDRGRRQRRPAATPSSQDARRHAPWATIAVCLLFSARDPDWCRNAEESASQIFAEMSIYPPLAPPLRSPRGFVRAALRCQSSARNVHFVRRSKGVAMHSITLSLGHKRELAARRRCRS